MISRVARTVCVRFDPGDVELAEALSAEALLLLLRALQYAHNSRCGVWHFAVELAQLRESGLSNGDVRWLACKGYVEHALETSPPCAFERSFDKSSSACFTDRSSFVLTAKGILLAQLLLSGAAVTTSDATASVADASPHRVGPTPLPIWDGQRREIRIGGILVKRFLVPAKNQETILSAFEEESWPEHIDDPLPPVPEIDPKRRLHSAIQCLNRNQQAPLLHFHGDGCGCGVRWESLSLPSQA